MSLVRAWVRVAVAGAWAVPTSALALTLVSAQRIQSSRFAQGFVLGFGVYSAALFTLLACAAVVLGSVLQREREVKPPAPAGILLRFGLLASVVLVLVATVLSRLLVPLVPHSLAARDAIAHCAAWYGSAPVLGLWSGLAWRMRGARSAYPAWIWAVLHVASRFVVATDLSEFAQGRESLVDLGSMVIVFTALSASPRPLRRVPRLEAALPLVAAAMALGSLVILNEKDSARDAIALAEPGASGMLAVPRALFDLDGDGFASILGGNDCDDGNPRTSPAAVEIVGNGVDDNCLGGDLARFTPEVPPSRGTGHSDGSILLITIDAMRADVSNGTLPEPKPMPEYERFGSGGAVFTRAYAAAPYTTDSLQALVTGSYPMSMTFGSLWLGSEPDLPTLLRAAGYMTEAVHSIWLKDPNSGVAAETTTSFLHFDHIDRSLAAINRDPSGVTSAQITDAALSHFDRLRQGSQPFLLWVHYFDMHAEYAERVGTPFTGRGLRERYLQEAWSTDRELGRFLRHVEDSGFLTNGLVAITGDHGELLGEHGRFQHAFWLDEAALRTTLTLRGRGVEPGRFDTRVRLIDVAPTMLELAASIRIHRAGRSLAPIWERREAQDRDVVVRSVYAGRIYKRAVLQGPWKLVQDIRAGTTELFNLQADPSESINIAEDEPERARRLLQQMGETFDVAINDQLLLRRRPNGSPPPGD